MGGLGTPTGRVSRGVRFVGITGFFNVTIYPIRCTTADCIPGPEIAKAAYAGER